MTVTLLVQPIYAAYYYDDPEGKEEVAMKGAGEFRRFNVIIDCVFLLDILINFRSAYVEVNNSKVNKIN